MVLFFEIVFVLSIIKNFTTEYKPDGISKPIRDIKKIAIKYLHNGFVMDFLMVLPFYDIFGSKGNAKLAYFIKIYRLVKGIRIFNVSNMIQRIQKSSIESMQKKIEKDEELGEDQLNDHNSIEEMLMLGYFLKTMKLVTMILNISFFVGIFFYVFCDLQAQIYNSYYTLPEGCGIVDHCAQCDEKSKLRCTEKGWYLQ